MAIFRKIHVTFWSDAFISSLEDKQKLFYLYLLTNERTTQLGVYEITKKQMAFDLGYTIDTVTKLIDIIQKTGKIRYNDKTSEMAVKNWNKYNGNESKKVKVLTDKESANIKDKTLIQYLYSIDTVSIHNPQEEEEEEEEQEETKEVAKKSKKIIIEDVISYFETNKYSKESAVKFFNYYEIAGWKDSKGNLVRNWKQKAQAVWFKPENIAPEHKKATFVS